MRTLLEDYQRKCEMIKEAIKNAREMVKENEELYYNMTFASTATRLRTKQSVYQSTIVDIERAIKREDEKFGTILGLIQNKINYYTGGEELKSITESVCDSHIVDVLKELLSEISNI